MRALVQAGRLAAPGRALERHGRLLLLVLLLPLLLLLLLLLGPVQSMLLQGEPCPGIHP
jgi:hypothetical protein